MRNLNRFENRRLDVARAALLAGALLPSGVLAQLCPPTPFTPYQQQYSQQSAMLSAPLPTLPPSLPDFSTLPLPVIPPQDGTGGPMQPYTPSTPQFSTPMVPNTPGQGNGGTTQTPVSGTLFSDKFSTIDPSKWAVNYPWGKIPGDATQ